MSGLLTLAGFKLVFYVAALVAVMVRLSIWKGRAKAALAQVEALTAQLAAANLQVVAATTDLQAIRDAQAAALAQAEEDRKKLLAEIQALKAPKDAQGAIDWLAEQAAKGGKP